MAAVVDLFAAILSALEHLRNVKKETREQRERRMTAIGKVREAALKTKAYQRQRDESAGSELGEESLSLAWQEAATAIEIYDHALAEIARVKALGWADPAEWNKPGVDLDKLKLDLILKQCDWLREHQAELTT